MRAYKFLDAQGGTVISGFRWPLPPDGQGGVWVDAPSAQPCLEGVHACHPADLAYWLNEQLWEIELDGDITSGHHKVVARRGRLLHRLDAWSARAARDLPVWCAWRARDEAVAVLDANEERSWAERLRNADSLRAVARVARAAVPALAGNLAGELSAGLAGDAAALAPTPYVAMGPFVAACAAAHAATHTDGATKADYTAAFATERQAQSDWIAHRLEIAEPSAH